VDGDSDRDAMGVGCGRSSRRGGGVEKEEESLRSVTVPVMLFYVRDRSGHVYLLGRNEGATPSSSCVSRESRVSRSMK
jgi:hypothetical protein